MVEASAHQIVTQIPVLLPAQAAAAVLTGIFLLFFGFFAYRATIVMYLALVGAVVGQVLGMRIFCSSSHQFLWGLVGALVGALIAVPVEVFLRVLLGVVSGAGLGLAIGVASGRWEAGLVGTAVGAVLGGALWGWLGEVFIMVAFALLGAADVMVGILSFMQRGRGSTLSLRPLHIVLLLVGAFLGACFQYTLHRPSRPPPAPSPESTHPDEQAGTT